LGWNHKAITSGDGKKIRKKSVPRDARPCYKKSKKLDWVHVKGTAISTEIGTQKGEGSGLQVEKREVRGKKKS